MLQFWKRRLIPDKTSLDSKLMDFTIKWVTTSLESWKHMSIWWVESMNKNRKLNRTICNELNFFKSLNISLKATWRSRENSSSIQQGKLGKEMVKSFKFLPSSPINFIACNISLLKVYWPISENLESSIESSKPETCSMLTDSISIHGFMVNACMDPKFWGRFGNSVNIQWVLSSAMKPNKYFFWV